MGQHSKYSFEMKLDAVTKYLEGSCSTESIARSLGTNGSRIIEWATLYQSLGAEGLKTTQKLSSYSAETKCSAVCDYLSGKGTLREIQKKYGIRSDKQLRNWIMKYNGHQIQNETVYLAIQEIYDEQGCPISELCRFAGISRSVYYKWLDRKPSENEKFNQKLCVLIKDAYEEKSGILGYRQMTVKLNRENEFQVNAKRILRLMRILHLKSVCRRRRRNYVKSTPEVTAENILNREFHAERFGEKWLTDVTEMKYGASGKAYLSAILDLADKSIVSIVIGHSNHNALVFETFDIAHENHPDAKPLFHSDRGYQYTSKSFRKKLNKAEMTQSMSRVSRCIDNGPMEAFRGMLKSEMYYPKKFQTYEELKEAISDYIDYYNNHRYQKRLNCMTPIEYRNYLKGAA